ncbi:kinesin-like protein KIF19 [Saccoglossus kowalevskii]|uniref:Kinesin-like protein KIF19-like n=1 Tax=Saccoglossus kowalevskii TaxID=10224 RepID=A0ABM0GQT7_SACKO|nr:PREDICTED: kinesin-like protein KIF19-like [Saccoglossus kowalevskii]
MSAKTAKNWRDHQLTVALRVRPFTEEELELAPTKIAHVVEDNMVVLLDPTEDPDDILRANRSREKQYVFDYAFDAKATQEDVYQQTSFLIDGVLDGFNATVFAYGATGAGKTYTMLGQDNDPGIMARTLNDLFTAMEDTSENQVYKVTMSYLEIYNEMIRDLLNPSSGFLDLREDAAGNVQVAGISEVSTKSTREVMRLLTRGNKERTSEPTAANKTSSRSHAVLQVTVKKRNRVRNISQEIRVGKLFMIDLAGSERAAQTKNRGKRMIEGAHINRSLLALGNCINALAEKGGNFKYVNFRDSKLTRLLKDSLGGNCRTVMIAHISPASMFFEESRNTLLYADRAKNIKTRVKANFFNVSFHIAQYTGIIADLRKEIARLKKKINEQEIQPTRTQGSASIKDIQSEVERTTAFQDRKEMDKLRQQLVSNFQEQMEIRRSLMELENTNMEIAMDTSKHLLTIAEWEQEKVRRASKKSNASKESLDNRESEKDLEKDVESSSQSPEPGEVIEARDEITSLLAEQKKTAELKSDLEKKLGVIKGSASKLEEILPNRINSEEQREILSLLCKVHELEIENTEIQSTALIRENLLRQKDLTIARYEQYRGLCDELIQQQRSLIDENHVVCTDDLDELYEQYQLMMDEGNLSRYASQTMTASQDMAVLHSQYQLDNDDSRSEDKDETPPSKKLLPRRSQESDSPKDNEPTRLFKQSPRSRQLREKQQASLIPKQSKSVPSETFLTQLSPHNSQTNSPTDLQFSSALGKNKNPNANPAATPKQLKQMALKTKNISAIAAKRKSKQVYSKPNFDRLNLQDKAVMSLNSVHEVSETDVEYLSPSRLAKHNKLLGHFTPPPGSMRQTLSDDNLSTDASDRKGVMSDSLSLNSRPKYRPKKNPSRQFDMRRRGKYESFEVQYSKKSNVQMKTGKKGKKSHIKYPPALQSDDNDLLSFDVVDSPPVVVYQSGVDRGKGQTIQKKYRGPTGNLNSDSSASSTPQGSHRPSKKQQPSIPAYAQKTSLSVSGFTVPRNERINRRL